MALKAKTYTE